MADPFVAEIRIVGFNFPPRGWAMCDGQLMPISQNTALFSLLGTTYGGDGKSTFGLPNLQGRAPMAPGRAPGLSDRTLGESGGSTTVALTDSQIPAHSHTLQGSGELGDNLNPGGNYLARGTAMYGAPESLGAGANGMLALAGDSQPHNNLQPYLALNFVIALQGIFPSRP